MARKRAEKVCIMDSTESCISEENKLHGNMRGAGKYPECWHLKERGRGDALESITKVMSYVFE